MKKQRRSLSEGHSEYLREFRFSALLRYHPEFFPIFVAHYCYTTGEHMKQLTIFIFCTFIPAWAGAQELAWTTTQGPYSTIVTAFGSDATSLLAGTNHGLFRSMDGGNTWSAAVSAGNPVNDIVVTGSYVYIGGSAGVTVSSDGGVNWAVRDSGLPQFSLVYALKYVKGPVYAALGSDGLYRTTSEGKYWEQLNSGGIENKSIFAIISTPNGSLLLAEGAGVIRSTDNGFSWNEAAGEIANQAVHRFVIKGTNIFAGTDAGIFRSSDDGATWNQFGAGIRGDDIISSLTIAGNAILAGTTDLNNQTGIYRSVDNGATWAQVNTGLSDLSVYALFASGDRVFAGTSLGISYSDNSGDLWTTASTGLPKPPIISLTSLYSQVFAGSAGSFIFRSNDAGEHWEISKSGLSRANVSALVTVGATLFAGTDAVVSHGTGGIHRSTDYGNTWTQINEGIPLMPITSLTNIGTKIYSGGDHGVVTSTDDGKNWSQMNTGLTDTIVKALSGFRGDLFAGTLSGVYKASGNWTLKNTGLSNVHIHALTSTVSSLYAGTDSGVYRHINDSDGFSWSRVSADSLFVQSLWSNDLLVAAGTKTGIYISSDNGKTWKSQQTAGIVSVDAFCAANRNLYAATNGGVIKAPLGQYGVNSSPAENALWVQATNPSHTRAMIRYSLKDRAEASLTVYDLLGKERAILFHDRRDPGIYDSECNTSLLPSGMYMLRLESAGKQATAVISVVH